ncbi:hypothetical protein HALDL1_08370 [Halobacterium sp. DL1]|jgi:hypothetical protein|nr:hypothetical protein HALDL1_08370 [Halobacterium sp. DL1]
MTLGEGPAGRDLADSTAATHIEYHEPTESYRAEFDQQTHPATEAVVTAVATATGMGPLELPPLYSVLDPDALDGLFSAAPDGPGQGESSLAFEYADQVVTVNGHGTVIVEPGEDSQA